MRPGRNWATRSQNYLWQTGSSNLDCSGSMRHIWTPPRINHLQVSYEVVWEAHDISRPKSGDLLLNRFWFDAEYVSLRKIGCFLASEACRHDSLDFLGSCGWSLSSTSLPGGNQVDGLPPAYWSRVIPVKVWLGPTLSRNFVWDATGYLYLTLDSLIIE